MSGLVMLAVLVVAGDGGTGLGPRDGPPAPRDGGSAVAELAQADAGEPSDAEEALERGLTWLAAQQAENVDGSFPKGRAEKHAPVGVTALAALAFMAAGTTPGRGPHGLALERAIDYLLSRADLTPGSARFGYIGTDGDQHSRMHGHGFAALALAEAYTSSPKSAHGARLEETLRAAVALIERTQGVEGGWYYEPQVMSDHEGSITICLVQALRAAKNAGLRVDSAVIGRAEDYVLRLQAEDGAFQYALNMPERTSIALTAAAIATLNAAGTYSGEVIERGTDAIWRYIAEQDEELREPGRWPEYERLYVAQAFWQHEDTSHFTRWWERERPRILSDQRADGSWHGREFGDCYATAISCLVLALPEATLPIFQR